MTYPPVLLAGITLALAVGGAALTGAQRDDRPPHSDGPAASAQVETARVPPIRADRHARERERCGRLVAREWQRLRERNGGGSIDAAAAREALSGLPVVCRRHLRDR